MIFRLEIEIISTKVDCRWHRLAFGVKGNSVTLLSNGEEVGTAAIERSNQPMRSSGFLVVGSEFQSDIHFEVS